MRHVRGSEERRQLEEIVEIDVRIVLVRLLLLHMTLLLIKSHYVGTCRYSTLGDVTYLLCQFLHSYSHQKR